jgi:hypothetical protein
VAAKLEVAAEVIQGLGPRGYLHNLINSILADVRALQTAGEPPQR